MTHPTVCGGTLKLRDSIALTALLSHVEAALVRAVGRPPDTEGEGVRVNELDASAHAATDRAHGRRSALQER
jgi:hypothetical protein